MGGISFQVLVTRSGVDHIGSQLATTAASVGLGRAVYGPTSSEQKSNHETDKQAEENATWVFEYRALLNSKLTTLTTSLTSAYTTDLDSAMGAKFAVWGGNKNAMQGLTGKQTGAPPSTIIDPGAARTTYAYLNGWGNTPGVTYSPGGTPDWMGDSANTAAGNATTVGMTVAAGGSITGTTTFLAGSNTNSNNLLLDNLIVNLTNTANNDFTQNKTPIISGLPAPIAAKRIGNNTELTLFKFFAKPENLDILRFGLFNDIYVVGTSSLPTGSQTQGSISLNWDNIAGQIVIKQERYAAFFHS